ncbi:mRNA decay activator protein ZFP36L2-like [Dipodomys spectabilis]|uniref:mRNA decay activator protein ZFP36L2-like n=1 Tax=Dipodomys spectabilis TaxID=105255 RepID=UPI001C53A8CF|nr:mRNA decay activator protein ZFP36L2-like [Dipodomys spectabilis]
MSTTRLSPCEIGFWCNTEKSVTDSNLDKVVDKKVVSTPWASSHNSSLMSGFLQQQHSDSNLHTPVHHAFGPSIWSPNFPGAVNGSSRFAASSLTSNSPLKEPSEIGCGTSLFNKNKFRNRSSSDNDQHLLEQNGRGGFSMNALRYKTELCRPFQEYGKCKYGEKCQFAHGFHELRNLSRHPKYKTEPCRTFHSIGFCPYGPRCHFIHDMPFEGPLGNRRSFSGRGRGLDFHPGVSQEPRQKVNPNLNFLGFPLDNEQPTKLLDSPIWRLPSPLSCFRDEAASTPSGTSMSSASGEVAPATPQSSSMDKLFPPGTSFANNAFDFGLELSSLISPVATKTHNFAGVTTHCNSNHQQQDPVSLAQTLAEPSGPIPSSAAAAAAAAATTTHTPLFSFQQLHRLSKSMFDVPSSSPDLLSDRDKYQSSSLSSGIFNGSEDPSLEPNHRLPIFSRLSISDN